MNRLIATIAAITLCMTTAFAEEKRPNIILITTDDQGYNDLSIQGTREIPTPFLDSIGHRGIRFTDGYVTAPLCGPSRTGFLTGQYQAKSGVEGNPGGRGPDLSVPRVQQLLKEAGYATGLIGKWHQGTDPEYLPNAVGFDYFFGTPSWGHFFIQPTAEEIAAGGDAWMRSWNDGIRDSTTGPRALATSGVFNIHRNGQRVTVTEYLTDAFSKEAVDFVERNKDNPFFLHVSYNAPHTPMQATQYYLDRFPHLSDANYRRTYAAMVSAVDDGVGRLIRKLEEHDIRDNTIIIFFSDNGGAAFSDEPDELSKHVIRGSRQEADYQARFGDSDLRWGRHAELRIGGNGADNYPLRFNKGTLFEGGIRVPFLLSWPAKLNEGEVFESPVSTLDILPTVLAAAGVKHPSPGDLDGKNLIPYIQGDEDLSGLEQRPLFWRYNQQRVARLGDWKLLGLPSGRDLLYNLRDDIGEKNDVSERFPEKVQELTTLWQSWNDSLPSRGPQQGGPAQERQPTANPARNQVGTPAGG